MTNSKGSVVVGDEGSESWAGGVVVVPDGGDEGHESLQDAGGDAGGGPAAVSFEVKLAFQCVVDGFDQLAQRLEEVSAETGLLPGVGGAQQVGVVGAQEGVELGRGVALSAMITWPGRCASSAG